MVHEIRFKPSSNKQLHSFNEEDAIVLKPLIISCLKNKEFLPLENAFVK